MLHAAVASWIVFYAVCFICCLCMLRRSLPFVLGHKACEVHGAGVDVEVSQEAEEEGEILVTCSVLLMSCEYA